MDNTTFDSDFRVLVVNGTSDSITKDITDYLNLITNGGYSSAVENESVDVVSQNYKFESGKFIINNDAKSIHYEFQKDQSRFLILWETIMITARTSLLY